MSRALVFSPLAIGGLAGALAGGVSGLGDVSLDGSVEVMSSGGVVALGTSVRGVGSGLSGSGGRLKSDRWWLRDAFTRETYDGG